MELDLITVLGSKQTWFCAGYPNCLGFNVGIEIDLVFVRGVEIDLVVLYWPKMTLF